MEIEVDALHLKFAALDVKTVGIRMLPQRDVPTPSIAWHRCPAVMARIKLSTEAEATAK